MQALFDWLLGAGREVAVFIVSMIPLIELRGAIPLATAAGMPWQQAFIIAVIGNILPIPFLILFAEKLIDWLGTLPPFTRLSEWYKNKLLRKTENLKKYTVFIGLFLFVALPIPGTGAWSGAAIASILKMPVRRAFPAIAAGVLTAGIIMTLLSQGVLQVANNF